MEKDIESANYNIKSLIKSVKLLEVLIEGGEMSIQELDSICQMGKSSVHRILGTFKTIGYVAQKPGDGKYYATIKMFELGNKVANRMTMRNIARPYLEELFRKCKETVNLAIFDKGETLYLDKITTEEPLRIDLEIGRRVPAYCSGLGKAFMAYTPDFKLDTLKFVQHTPATITTHELLAKELEEVKNQGYAVDNEEYIEGLVCIAMPIFGQKNEIVAALSIAVPTIRFNASRKKQFIEYLKEETDKIQRFMS
ncbi:MAG: IclR family transcriptional regulator [Clostridia bacterium]